MRVLDLFAGLGGWSAPFRDHGHDVTTLDVDPRFGCDLTIDVLEWESAGRYDVITASPPCECFSVMTFGRYWRPGRIPRDDKARLAVRLVERTVELIELLEPAYYVVENPVGMLRKLPPLAGRERRTVTYCQYGTPFRKPTDLWGGFPPSLELRRMCRNGDPCHVAAPRGSFTGIQGEGVVDLWGNPSSSSYTPGQAGSCTHIDGADPRERAALRAVIPYRLADAFRSACERDLEAGNPAARVQLSLLDR